MSSAVMQGDLWIDDVDGELLIPLRMSAYYELGWVCWSNSSVNIVIRGTEYFDSDTVRLLSRSSPDEA